MLLVNGRMSEKHRLCERAVRIKDATIVEIGEDLHPEEDEKTINLNGGLIIPGAVDVHVHLREPGFEQKETAQTGTYSAAKGGVTTIMSMPNLNPVIDSVEHAEYMRGRIMPYAYVRVCPYGSVTLGEMGKKTVDFDGMSDWVYAFSDDGKGIEDDAVFCHALKVAKSAGVMIASHAEAEGYGTSPKAEYLAVQREIECLKKTGGKLHFCHMSTRRSFELIAEAKRNGLDVSAEVTPHHLFLNEECINDNPNFKMNPPLRCEDDRIATVEALIKGVADFVATDHAPHTEEEKNQSYAHAPSGVVGLETMLPLVYTFLVKTGKISIDKMIEITSQRAGKRFDLPYSSLKVGDSADIAVLDIDNAHTYTKEEIVSKGKNSPFVGQTLFGFNKLTLVAGKVVYQA